MHNIDQQRELTSLLLDHLGSYSFVLAGSGAVREHGLIERPTQDIDLFAMSTLSEAAFSEALSTLPEFMNEHGWTMQFTRPGPTFAQCLFTNKYGTFEADLGVDWRAHDPTMSVLGPILALEDAVSAKLSALYSRALPRDFIDAYSIRKNGPYSDEQLLELIKERDPGFDREVFAIQLESIQRFDSWPVGTYDEADVETFATVKASMLDWARDIRVSITPLVVLPGVNVRPKLQHSTHACTPSSPSPGNNTSRSRGRTL